MKTFSLIAYTFSHFAVDYVCLLTVLDPWGEKTEILGGVQNYALFVITYNFLAFGLQMFLGAFCDEHRKFPAGAFGCLFVFAGVMSRVNIYDADPIYAPWLWASVILVGIGNAFFHVGGGIDSLVHSGGKLARSGVFVSSGAIGVALGIYNAGRGTGGIIIALLMIFCAVLCLIAHRKCPTDGKIEIKGAANKKAGIYLVVSLALVSVLIRSFGGTVIPMEWKTAAKFGLVSGAAAFAGKFLGGFAADRFGARQTGVMSLLLSIPLLTWGREIMPVSVLGIILFNMTMPITLGIIAEKFPKSPGITFGLTTAALLLGAAPSFFVALGGNIALLVPAILVSAICIFFSAGSKKTAEEG